MKAVLDQLIHEVSNDSRIWAIALVIALGMVAFGLVALVVLCLIYRGFDYRRDDGRTSTELRTAAASQKCVPAGWTLQQHCGNPNTEPAKGSTASSIETKRQ